MVTQEGRKEIQELLKEIWEEFRRVGTTNELEIVESIAEMLVGDQANGIPEVFRPRAPRNRYSLEKDITSLLDHASGLAGGKGMLFDRYLLFYAALKPKKGEFFYPVPRHLVDFMLTLLQVKPHHSFADFTCGTGGFLVNRDGGENRQQGLTLGIEKSPEAARLAGANALLHSMNEQHTKLHLGDALQICQPTVPLWFTGEEVGPGSFERIAMAPPFGLTIEASLANKWTNGESGRRSENLFTRLALKMLTAGGYAALLVPTGLTYSETLGHPALRKLLLQQCTLHAVITLEGDMLAPYSNVSTSILFLQKSSPPADQQPWFFRVARDGYPLGMGRNLLLAPELAPVQNDLPLVEQALLLSEGSFSPVATAETAEVGLTFAFISQSYHYGVVIRANERTAILSIRCFRVESPVGARVCLLIVTRHMDGGMVYTVMPPSAEGIDPDNIKDYIGVFTDSQEALHKLRTDLRAEHIQDIQQGLRVFREGQAGQKIAIRTDGRVLGVTQPRFVLEEGHSELQPARYVQLPDEIGDTRPPVEILSQIQRSQNLVSRHIDNLLGQLEVRAVVGEELPPRIYSLEHLKLLKALGSEQQLIWNMILKQTDAEGHALYFTAEHIQQLLRQSSGAGQEISRASIQQTLDLLERMGLIMSKLLVFQQQSKPLICYRYRRVTTLDIADLQAKGEDL